MATKIFVNLPVQNLVKTKRFFQQLGYEFNPQFTDKNAACLVISENIYAMLITREYFARFTKRTIADAAITTEVIIALSASSRAEVNELTTKAVEAGGRIHREPEDQGWMYGQSIEDLDGHIWEFIYMADNQTDLTNN